MTDRQTRRKSAPRRPRRAPSELPVPARDLDGMLKRLHLPTVRRLYGDLATRAETEGMGYRTYLEQGVHFALRGRSYRARHRSEEESSPRRAKSA